MSKRGGCTNHKETGNSNLAPAVEPAGPDDAIEADLRRMGEPILSSAPFERLSTVTFLGVLSPRYWHLPGCPFRKMDSGAAPTDGSRLQHSVGVALLALGLAKQLGLGDRAQRLAVAWGLLHDIATWPLSHTGEAAFAVARGIDPRGIRRMMILGDENLPKRFHLVGPLRHMAVDPSLLTAILEPRALENAARRWSKGFFEEAIALWQIIHSPMTPDTLEGIHRCCLTFGVPAPDLAALRHAVSATFFGPGIEQEDTHLFLDFWRTKAKVYRQFINRAAVVTWESKCSAILRDSFAEVPGPATMNLDEAHLASAIEAAFRRRRRISLLRYKPPRTYYLSDDYLKRPALKKPVLVDELSAILRSRKMKVGKNGIRTSEEIS